MHFSHCITKAKHTHSEHIIFTDFPRQQWLHKHASLLHYAYNACLVTSYGQCRVSYSFMALPVLNNFSWNVQNTGWSKSLCAPDDYNTENCKQHSKWLAANHQVQGNIRLTLMPSVIPTSNYIFMVSDWNGLKYFCLFFCTVIISCTETFWSPCISPIDVDFLGDKESERHSETKSYPIKW
jgi:hypothetical protein